MRPTTSVGGEVVQLVPVGDLAAALGRSVSHVRWLEAHGVLPPAQIRRQVKGHRGWRLYDRRFVEEVAKIALEERVLQRRRVNDLSRFSSRVWDAHRALLATAGSSERAAG
jgi:hypothetical protein